VVGAGQQLSITKQAVAVGGGAAVPGAQLEYVVRVVNITAVPAINVVITDDLDASQPGQLAYVNGSATLNGSAAGVTFAGSTITANYAAVSGSLEPGEVVVLRFRAILAPARGRLVVTNTRGAGTGLKLRAPACRSSSAASPLRRPERVSLACRRLRRCRDSGERALAMGSGLYRNGCWCIRR
jgi:uncharacterized repeat protein (TIGR01451 family)